MADTGTGRGRSQHDQPHDPELGEGRTPRHSAHHPGTRSDTGWIPVAVGNAPCRLMIPDSCRVMGYFIVGFVP